MLAAVAFLTVAEPMAVLVLRRRAVYMPAARDLFAFPPTARPCLRASGG